MSAMRSTSLADDGSSVDASPLLSGGGGDSGRRGSPRRAGLLGAVRLIQQAGSRRMMRDPSMAVRETAAEHLEERQSDWAYSRPVVILDTLWNLVFVAASAGVLISSREETPSMPLRVWIVGYAVQCLLHILLVYLEYGRRRRSVGGGGGSNRGRRSSGRSSSWDAMEAGLYGGELSLDEGTASIAKHLESANTMFSFIWWIIGFYWVSVGGPVLTHDAPRLYWLCIVFLAFDVFFIVFCVALACVIGLAVCCCLPCIIAILYAFTDKQGASNEDIRQLPTFKFRKNADPDIITGEMQKGYGGVIIECGSDSPTEYVLSAEDAECCICLSAYDDEVELRLLPCKHHFHSTCIDKWLFINATCPLCKSNIVNSNVDRGEEV